MRFVLARLRTIVTALAVVMLGMVFLAGPSSAEGNTNQVCAGLDSGKIDVSGNQTSITVTAPEGQLITEYCVKAGSTKQGNGPKYVPVNPPAETVTITYTAADGKAKGISHYSLSYGTEPPAEGELDVPATPEMIDPCDPDNAAWVVPADDEVFDWTLDNAGNLSVTILTPDTVFTGTDSNTHDFGAVTEENTEPCDVAGEEEEKDPPKNPDGPDNPGNPDTPETPEVKGAQAAVPTAVDAGLDAAPASDSEIRNPLWLLVVAAGLGLIGLAGLRRRAVGSR